MHEHLYLFTKNPIAMAKKKLKLNELKIKSIATTLNEQEQKTAKGGYFDDSKQASFAYGDWNIWTVEKTGHRPGGFYSPGRFKGDGLQTQ